MQIKEDFLKIRGNGNITDDPEILEKYSRDMEFANSIKPSLVIKPANVSEVQEVVRWANQTKTPLIPVSSGPPHFHGDTVPSVAGAVVLDLSGMNKILKINRRNRMAVIESGVTYGQLQPELAKEGLRLSPPLLPRANKSVITSLLEREPRLNSRYQWSSMDPLRSMEIVWGDGNRLWSGEAGNGIRDLEKQWSQQRFQVEALGPGQTNFHRLLSASQGSLGMVTWASVKCEVLPSIHKLFFVPGKKLNDLIDFTYKLLRFRFGDELFLMNNTDLAYLLGNSPEQIKTLKSLLPTWVIILAVAGRDELPVERVNFLEKDIGEIAKQFGLELKENIPGANGSQVLEIILNPSREPYWKLAYKGGCQDIFFVTTLDKAPKLAEIMHNLTETPGYPFSETGIYLQPRHQGVNIHCEFNLPYNPGKPEEVACVRELFIRASETLAGQGAFFTRPYGIWADLAFRRDEGSSRLLRHIKGVFDPNGIMNPGKLCFKVKETEER